MTATMEKSQNESKFRDEWTLRFELSMDSVGKLLILVRPDGFEPPTTWFEVRITPHYRVLRATLGYAISMAYLQGFSLLREFSTGGTIAPGNFLVTQRTDGRCQQNSCAKTPSGPYPT